MAAGQFKNINMLLNSPLENRYVCIRWFDSVQGKKLSYSEFLNMKIYSVALVTVSEKYTNSLSSNGNCSVIITEETRKH